jgi:hypothetical protein
MSERIRILEDALTTLHASKDGADGAVHPLLVEGEDFSLGADDAPTASRRMSESWEVLESPDGKTAVAGPSGDVIDAFGTLSISDHGISRFFGPTGGCEVCNFFSSALYPSFLLPLWWTEGRHIFLGLRGDLSAKWHMLICLGYP